MVPCFMQTNLYSRVCLQTSDCITIFYVMVEFHPGMVHVLETIIECVPHFSVVASCSALTTARLCK